MRAARPRRVEAGVRGAGLDFAVDHALEPARERGVRRMVGVVRSLRRIRLARSTVAGISTNAKMSSVRDAVREREAHGVDRSAATEFTRDDELRPAALVERAAAACRCAGSDPARCNRRSRRAALAVGTRGDNGLHAIATAIITGISTKLMRKARERMAVWYSGRGDGEDLRDRHGRRLRRRIAPRAGRCGRRCRAATAA